MFFSLNIQIVVWIKFETLFYIVEQLLWLQKLFFHRSLLFLKYGDQVDSHAKEEGIGQGGRMNLDMGTLDYNITLILALIPLRLETHDKLMFICFDEVVWMDVSTTFSLAQLIHWLICKQYRKTYIRSVKFHCKERNSAHSIPGFACSVSPTLLPCLINSNNYLLEKPCWVHPSPWIGVYSCVYPILCAGILSQCLSHNIFYLVSNFTIDSRFLCQRNFLGLICL